jgi:hypothetical protein
MTNSTASLFKKTSISLCRTTVYKDNNDDISTLSAKVYKDNSCDMSMFSACIEVFSRHQPCRSGVRNERF